jgi:hypothetical protein
MFRFVAPRPEYPKPWIKFSTDLISLDRFGSKGDIAGRRYVRPRVVALVSKRLATGVL